MKIVLFAKGDRRLPSARTRAWMLSDYLVSEGYDSSCYHVVTRPWWQISLARIREDIRNIQLLLNAQATDVVFLQRTVHQIDFMILVLLRRFLLRRGYVFDFDDAIFLEKGRGDLKARIMLRFADAVFCSSEFLKKYADKYNKNVHIISAALDTKNVYTVRNDDSRSEVVIGWTGTPVHLENMKLLVPALTRLAAENAPIRLELLGGGEEIAALFREIPNLKLVEHSFPPSALIWTKPREVADYLKNFDIGVMPLQPTEWNKGKDAWKAKEYMACGVAAAVSAWGENPLLIKDGDNGVLVDEGEWYEKLKRLIEGVEFRKGVAARGRTYIEREYSYDVLTKKMLTVIQKGMHNDRDRSQVRKSPFARIRFAILSALYRIPLTKRFAEQRLPMHRKGYRAYWVSEEGAPYRQSTFQRQHKEGSSPLIANPTYDEIRAVINAHQPNTVFEIGCGWGRILEALADSFEVSGCDVSKDLLKKVPSHINAIQMDIVYPSEEWIESNKSSWDVVIAHALFMYFYNQPDDMRRAMKHAEYIARDKVIVWEWPHICEKMKEVYPSPKFEYHKKQYVEE